MIKQYQDESFMLNRNVLLIAHSQGNLFGNEVYQNLTKKQKEKFEMVSVGTPSSHVLNIYAQAIAPYTTLHGDFIIESISGSLPSNASGFGHTFVDSYLNESNIKSRNNIIQDINDAIDIFTNIECQKIYDYYRFISYICPTRQAQELVVDIYGTPPAKAEEFRYEEYITSDRRLRGFQDVVPIVDTHLSSSNGVSSDVFPTQECIVAGNDVRAYVPTYNKNGCMAYTFTDSSPEWTYYSDSGNNSYMYEGTLDYIMGSVYSNQQTCTTYGMNTGVKTFLTSSSSYYEEQP